MLINQILLVDDEPDIRTMLSILLRKQLGAAVVSCPDIDTALEQIDQSDFDLALLDISLKQGTGYELISPLRKRFGSDIKIIMISAFENASEKEKMKALGVDFFIGKPLHMSKIKSSLQELGFSI